MFHFLFWFASVFMSQRSKIERMYRLRYMFSLHRCEAWLLDTFCEGVVSLLTDFLVALETQLPD